MTDAAQEALLQFLWQILLAGLLGMTIGLDRERVGQEDPNRAQFAGLRTFGLVGVMGCLAAMIGAATHIAVTAVAFAGLAALATISYLHDVNQERGVTTEVTFLLTFLIGVAVQQKLYLQSSALTLGVVAILTYRPALHGFASRVSREDISNAIKFGLVSLVILPILPDRTFDPWHVLNPYVVWWMVVLMSGISFAGYILVKVVGARAGIGLTGLLGGLVSSTAVTLTFSQRSRVGAGALARPYAMAVVVACTILYPRLFIEAVAIHRGFALELAPLLGASLVIGLVLAAMLYRRPPEGAPTGDTRPVGGETQVQFKNPFELLPAIKFAGVFAVVVFVIKFGRHFLGDSGAYLAAALAGLTDVDAITLSMARATLEGTISTEVALRSVVLATVSNTCVKTGLVLTLGGAEFRRGAGSALALLALGTGTILAAWVMIGG